MWYHIRPQKLKTAKLVELFIACRMRMYVRKKISKYDLLHLSIVLEAIYFRAIF